MQKLNFKKSKAMQKSHLYLRKNTQKPIFTKMKKKHTQLSCKNSKTNTFLLEINY